MHLCLSPSTALLAVHSTHTGVNGLIALLTGTLPPTVMFELLPLTPSLFGAPPSLSAFYPSSAVGDLALVIFGF